MSTEIPATCGIFLIDPEGHVLIIHATNARWNVWVIPKGLPDTGESYKDAAVRELLEETSLNIDDLVKSREEIEYLGSSKYEKRNKKLEAFWVLLPHPIVMETLECTSMVTGKGKAPFPEVDKYMTVPLEEADKWLHQTQIELLPLLKKKFADHKKNT